MTVYQKLEYNLELITPAFIGGAFPEAQAELRPASFIGILRWWFRNLALTVTDDIDAIYSLESKLFGNTEKAGKVWVKFKRIITQDYEEFENLTGVDIFNLAYLGYGNFSFVNCRRNGDKYPQICNKNPTNRNTNIKAFIPPRTAINLILLVPKKYEKLIKSFLSIVSQIGAIGGRNRRGWGNFYLNPLDEKDYWEACKVEKAYRNFVKEICKYIPKGSPAQTIEVYEKHDKKSNPLEVLNEIGGVYKNFRKKLNPDYIQLKQFLMKKHKYPAIIYNRAWFGLPIIARYRSLNGKTATVNVFHNNRQERLGSPVIFRVFRDKKEKYGILLIVFYKKKFFGEVKNFYKWFLGNSREVKAVGKGVRPKSIVMNRSFKDFIDDFLKAAKVITPPTLTLP